MNRVSAFASLALSVLLMACGPTLKLVRAGPPSDALRAAVDRFYAAENAEQMKLALAEAEREGPNSALFHQIAALHELLHERDSGAIEHLMLALLDPDNDFPEIDLNTLMGVTLTYEQRERVRDFLQQLVAEHPNPSFRAVAAFHLASYLGSEGRYSERAEVMQTIEGRLKFSVVGPWDNDQGKGFDLELAPEQRPGWNETYEGRTGTLRWRRDVPTDPRGRLDLGSLMYPSRWAVAFAQTETTVAEEGTYELRMLSSDPMKVWVDGKLVFAAPQLERFVYDHLSIPVKLRAGTHRIMVKSAHRDGAWALVGRLVKATKPSLGVNDLESALADHLSSLPDNSARSAILTIDWTHDAAGGNFTVKAADQAARRWPKSIMARLWQVEALWFNQERGRTADILQKLDADVGASFPFIRLRQARFNQQQGLKQKAREQVLELVKTAPVRSAYELLVESYRAEGWLEDELRTQQLIHDRFGKTPDSQAELARMLIRFGRREAGLHEYDQILSRIPRHSDTLRRLSDLSLDEGDLGEAERLLTLRLQSWPTDYGAWMQVAEIQRRRGAYDDAEKSIMRARELIPESPGPVQKRGDLAYERGEVSDAVVAWKEAFTLNPENESLANRIEFIAPEDRGPWMADVPDEAAIDAAVKSRKTLSQTAGADVAWLLDHEVTLLNSDGSTSNVVTLVAHAFNAQGRDRIIRQSIGSGRLRMLHSYSIDQKGQRTEASGERSRQVFFRGMQPGATLVLQYRLDTPPQGFLARYLSKAWTFQSFSEQRTEGTFVLWTPLNAVLHEQRVGEVKRTEDKRGDQLRIVWTAKNVPPVISEPGMPTSQEIAANIRISTVPDWKTWLSWEQALLEGVFRDSPEIDALAKQLEDGAGDANERLKRIHSYVMEEIRYQQDYESFIAGVKPHPAPMVLERKYGDCKDKAVLFIELAKKLGLEAHFALVRTRDAGPVVKDVPMQQFNHAIVYVPEQKGVERGRFFDPTAELLDVDSVRYDDTGTKSLVFDPKTATHAWRDIELQSSDFNHLTTSFRLSVDASGAASGTMSMTGVGRDGSHLRRAARNDEVLKQIVQRTGSNFLPNATTTNPRAVEVKSLRVPAVIDTNIEAKTLGRAEGETLRIKMPSDWNPRSLFSLSERKHPLLLGAPVKYETLVELALPENFVVSKLPASASVELPCLSLKRELKSDGKSVFSRQTFQTLCERITEKEYATYRARVDDMVKLLEDELVVSPAKGGSPKKPVAPPTKK